MFAFAPDIAVVNKKGFYSNIFYKTAYDGPGCFETILISGAIEILPLFTEYRRPES